MRIHNRWRVGMWLFLIIILTVSSVAVTITLLEWNIHRMQRTLGKDTLKNDSLSRHPFAFPRELAKGRIQKDAYAEKDLVVSNLINQYWRYLLMMAPAGRPRYRTDTVLGIEAAQRPLTIADQEIIRTLKAELNANPSPERRRTIEAELKRIYEETTSRAGTDEVTTNR